ncbi:hypothetical protein [Halomarina pelagica]|uniref:hypothetical protein n=1 Tax=Halomarina pelagica TaxID=2961599 RepID=UPI0020C56ABF|nr:hypothetical protein [Halomarina sp. BND7]
MTMQGGEVDEEAAVAALMQGGGLEYGEKVAAAQEATRAYLRDLWEYHGGAQRVAWEEGMDEEAARALYRLTQLVRHARAPLRKEGDAWHASRGGFNRAHEMLRDLARGHALLYGRERVTMEDVELLGLVVPTTVPLDRRPLVEALLDPAPARDHPLVFYAEDVKDLTGVSTPTAITRLEQLAALGLGVLATGPRGRKELILKTKEFMWPLESFPGGEQ